MSSCISRNLAPEAMLAWIICPLSAVMDWLSLSAASIMLLRPAKHVARSDPLEGSHSLLASRKTAILWSSRAGPWLESISASKAK